MVTYYCCYGYLSAKYVLQIVQFTRFMLIIVLGLNCEKRIPVEFWLMFSKKLISMRG